MPLWATCGNAVLLLSESSAPPDSSAGTGTNTYRNCGVSNSTNNLWISGIGWDGLMNKLAWDFSQQQRHNRDGSYSTQAARAATLRLSSKHLRELGYRNLRSETFGQRHLRALVAHWQGCGISDGVLKNRMSHLRWALEKAGRAGVARITNDELGIARRTYVAKESKARDLPTANLERITDQHVRHSLRLQAAFGLRREEAIKFIAAIADKGDRIELRASWTKGGKARSIPVRTLLQRMVLDEVSAFAGNASLIPAHLSYREHMRRYEDQIRAAGLTRMHGLRHHYAQQRYLDLTGKQAPAVRASLERVEQGQLIGGTEPGWLGQVGAIPSLTTPTHSGLSDREARQLISLELGHERTSITSVYLGSSK